MQEYTFASHEFVIGKLKKLQDIPDLKKVSDQLIHFYIRNYLQVTYCFIFYFENKSYFACESSVFDYVSGC